MAEQPRVTIVLGTRPEAIKLAPVIRMFQACDALQTRVVLTGQHREMVGQVMDLFHLQADQDLNLMAPRQTCLLYTSPSPRDRQKSRMPSSA